MSFEEGLYAYLSVYPGLAFLVGTRLYPVLLPQEPTFPAVTYTRISTSRLLAFERSFLPHPRFQFDCWAQDTAVKSGYDIAKDVAEQVQLALDVYRGAMGAETVEVSLLDGEHDMFDPDTKIWHVVVDAIIWHE